MQIYTNQCSRYGLWILLLLLSCACKSGFNSRAPSSDSAPISSPSTNYLPISGGTLTGSLNVPSNGFTIGTNQLTSVGGRIGIGTNAPVSALNVAGIATFDNMLNAVGPTNLGNTLDVTGVATFDNMLNAVGPTNLSSTLDVTGVATFDNDVNITGASTLADTLSVTGASTFLDSLTAMDVTELKGTAAGSAAVNASVLIQPVTTNANDALLGIVSGGVAKFKIDNEGDVTMAGDLDLGGALDCIECIDLPNIKVGIGDSILSTSLAGSLEWQLPKLQYGLKFEFVNASSLRLVPSGINAKASVFVTNGIEIKSVAIAANLTASLAVNGAGGLDIGAEAANTGYDVRVISNAAGTLTNLLLTVAGNTPTLPAAYTYVSEVLWFVSNSQGAGNLDIARFADIGDGICQYLLSNGIRVLNDGEAAVVTGVDLSVAASPSTANVGVYINPTNLDALTNTTLRLYYDAAGATQFASLGNLINSLLVGSTTNRSAYFELPIHNGLTNSLFYSFSSLPVIGNFGVDIYVQKWKLSSRMTR